MFELFIPKIFVIISIAIGVRTSKKNRKKGKKKQIEPIADKIRCLYWSIKMKVICSYYSAVSTLYRR